MEANVQQSSSHDVKLDETKKEDSKKKRQRARKKKSKQDLTCPMKILESVLSNASYKVPNLSQEVERKFYHTPDYSKKLASLLEDVVYLPTVGEVNEDQSDVPVSVFPIGFEGQVEVPPSAIMSLDCINAVPKKRLKWVRKKGKVKNNNVKATTNNKEAAEEEDSIKEKKDAIKREDVTKVKDVNLEVKREENESKINDADNNKQINGNQCDMDKTDTNRNDFNGQVSTEVVAGNGTNGKKKRRKRKKQHNQNNDEIGLGGSIKTNGEV